MFNHHALPRTTLATAVAAVALSLPMTAFAQLEEVIVTAQKRSESLQDVPISIDAFSGDELQELGVQSAHEILRLIPNAGTVPRAGRSSSPSVAWAQRLPSQCGGCRRRFSG